MGFCWLLSPSFAMRGNVIDANRELPPGYGRSRMNLGDETAHRLLGPSRPSATFPRSWQCVHHGETNHDQVVPGLAVGEAGELTTARFGRIMVNVLAPESWSFVVAISRAPRPNGDKIVIGRPPRRHRCAPCCVTLRRHLIGCHLKDLTERRPVASLGQFSLKDSLPATLSSLAHRCQLGSLIARSRVHLVHKAPVLDA